MSSTKSTLGQYFTVNTITGYTNYTDLVLNIQKRRGTVQYKSHANTSHPLISYISTAKLSASNNMTIIDRSNAISTNNIMKNSEYLLGESVKTFTVDTDKVLITDIFVEETATQNAAALFYQHNISVNHFDSSAGHKILSYKILDDTFQEISVSDEYLDTTNGIYYNNLENEYTGNGETYKVYYIQYTVKESSSSVKSYTVLLNNRSVFSAATLDDLSDSGNLISDRKVYIVEEIGIGAFYFTLPATKKYALKKNITSYIKLLPSITTGIEDPWYVRVSDGSFYATINTSVYRYRIAEILNQSFTPYMPLRSAQQEEAIILSSNLIKLAYTNIYTNDPEKLYITALIYDESDVLLYAPTTNPSLHGTWASTDVLYSNLDEGGTYGVRSYDRRWGFVDIQGITLKDSYKVKCSYYYEYSDLLLTAANFNPLQNADILKQTVIVFLIPDNISSSRTQNVFVLLCDENGKVTYTDWEDSNGFNNTTGKLRSGKYLFYEDAPSWFILENGADSYVNFYETYTCNGSTTAPYLILGEVRVSAADSPSILSNIDIRQEGGGLSLNSPFRFTDYVRSCWDLAKWDGDIYPDTGAYLVEVPVELLYDAGGVLLNSEIKEKVKKHTALGIYPVIRAYGIDPYILTNIPGDGSITITWNHAAEDVYYNIYTSKNSDGPFTLYNASPLVENSTLNTYTLVGLDNDVSYYIYVVGGRYNDESQWIPLSTQIIGPNTSGSQGATSLRYIKSRPGLPRSTNLLGCEFYLDHIYLYDRCCMEFNIDLSMIAANSSLRHEFIIPDILSNYALGQEFLIDYLMKNSNLQQEFDVQLLGSDFLNMEFDVDGILVMSGLNQEFDITGILTSSYLNQEFDIQSIIASGILNNEFNITGILAASILNQEFNIDGIITSSTLNNEFNINGILWSSSLNNEFNIVSILAASVLQSEFNVDGINTSSYLQQEFFVNFLGSSVLQSEFNVSSIIANGNLQEEFTIDAINTLKVFCWDPNSTTPGYMLPGIDNLDPSLTINGATETPVFRYKGKDANATTWSGWTYGTTLDLQAGTLPSFNQETPFFNSNDGSMTFSNGGYYLAPNTTFADITTEDLVIEVIFKIPSDQTGYQYGLIGKGDTSAGTGWGLYHNVNSLRFAFRDGTDMSEFTVGTVMLDTWYHAIAFINRDENSTDGALWYLNGLTTSNNTNMYALKESLTNSSAFTLGRTYWYGNKNSYTKVAYLAMWKRSSWHQAGAAGPAEWATIAKTRFHKLTGIYPQLAKGTALSTYARAATQVGQTYTDKYIGNARKLFKIGKNWPKIVKRKDANNNIYYGYFGEGWGDQNLTWSENFTGANWTVTSGMVATYQGESPDFNNTVNSFIADSNDLLHSISQATTANLTAQAWVSSIWAKKGDKNWIYLSNNTVSNAYGYFDINSGVLGTIGAGAVGWIEDWGDNWYRCGLKFTGTAAAHTLVFAPAEANGDNTFAGSGITNDIYAFGSQIEASIEYPSTFLPTALASFSRGDEILRYKMDDGNIGGVGSDKKGTVLISGILKSNFNTASEVDDYIFSLNDGGSSSDFIHGFYALNLSKNYSIIKSSEGSNNGLNVSKDVSNGVIHSCRFSWDTDKQLITADSTTNTSTAALTPPNDIDRFEVGQYVNNQFQFNGLISGIKLYSDYDATVNTFKLFCWDEGTTASGTGYPGIDNLDPSLTINGATETPVFRYKGGDADGTDWNYWTYGEDLALQAGTAPSYNQGSPLLGTNDDSVKFNAGGYYKAANTSFGDIATEDIALEIVFKYAHAGTYGMIAEKNSNVAGTASWQLYSYNVSSPLIFKMYDGVDSGSVSVVNLVEGAWYHAIVFVNRSENSTNSAVMYVNAVAGAGSNFIAVDTVTNLGYTAIGSRVGSIPYQSNVAYLALWKRASWHQEGAAGPAEWATIAAKRFAQLTGIYPQLATGTALPTTATRNAVGYIDKYESGIRKLYKVGANWMRVCSRRAADGTVMIGALFEKKTVNLCLQSEDLANIWVPNASVIFRNQAISPNQESTSDALVSSNTDTPHYISQTLTLTAAIHCYSVYLKKGAKDWAVLKVSTLSTPAVAYFNLNTGVVGTATGCDSYIEDWGDGWYRCAIRYTGTAAIHTHILGAADADNDDTFVGGFTPNVYLWGANIRRGDRFVPYLYTESSTTWGTIFTDTFYFKGDDGNLGGVGSNGTGTIIFSGIQGPYTKVWGGEFTIVNIADGAAATDLIQITQIASSSQALKFVTTSTETPNGLVTGTSNFLDNIPHNIKATWKTNELKLYFDGVAEGSTDTSVTLPNDLDQIGIGGYRPYESNSYNDAVLWCLKFYDNII